MVKIKGPMGSAEAAGTFGGSAVFSSWKGRAYARRPFTPTNPKTAMQVGTRAMMAFLASHWPDLSVDDKATWNPGGLAAGISAYNQFISVNLSRWKEFQAPSHAYPAAETGTLGSLDTCDAHGHAGHADLSATFYELGADWGLAIFRSLVSGFVPSRQNAIAIVKRAAPENWLWTDEGLAPGTYYYQLRQFSTAGKLGPALGQMTAIVT
jgi:hypothetical protein